MTVTAALVKQLREMTGAGMMECKKALTETAGDMDKAVELMRKKGQAKAAKKSGRIAAEGLVTIAVSGDKKSAAIVEVNCETDFVGREQEFASFANQVAQAELVHRTNDVAKLAELNLVDGNPETVEEKRKTLVAKLGENIQVRRVKTIDAEGMIGTYTHGNRIGVVVDVTTTDDELARDLAMHIAASKPDFVKPEHVSEDVVNREKEIFKAQALESGKPAEIVEKMIGGRIKKFLAEITLYGQAFVKDLNQTVEAFLKSKSAEVKHFVRFEVGEGIEKKADNFAEEVRAQAKAAAGE